MQKHLYKEHYELEEKHWWFVGKKTIVLSLINKYMDKNKKNVILDAGCGTGLMLKSLSKLGLTKGMDFSEDAIEFSKKMFDGDIKQGWLPDNIPFDNKSFDVIVCLDVIEHIDNDQNALLALKEKLTENGVLIITVPALMSLWSKWDTLNEHKRRYNIKDLKKVLIDCGLHINKISYFNSFLFLPIYLIRKINNLLKRDENKSDTDLPNNFVNFILKTIFSFEKFWLKYFNFPIGISLIAVVNKNK